MRVAPLQNTLPKRLSLPAARVLRPTVILVFVYTWAQIPSVKAAEPSVSPPRLIQGVSAIAVSHDARSIATISRDGDLVIWDMATQSARWCLRDGIVAASFLASKQDVAVLRRIRSNDSTTRMLLSVESLDGRQDLSSWTGLGIQGYLRVFSPEGEQVITLDGSDTSRRYSVKMRHLRHEDAGWTAVLNNGKPTALAINQRIERVAVGTENGRCLLLDFRTGKKMAELPRSAAAIRSVAMSTDGEALLAGCDDGTANLWDTRSLHRVHALRGHSRRVAGVCFNSNRDEIATVSFDRQAIVWSRRTGAKMHVFKELGYLSSVTFSPDGRSLMAGSHFGIFPGGCVTVWSLETGEVVGRFGDNAGGVVCARFSPNSLQIVAGYTGGVAVLWGTDDFSAKHVFRGDARQRVLSAVFSPSGEEVATGHERGHGTVRIWNAQSGELIRIRTFDNKLASSESLEFSADGKSLLVGGRVWNIETDELSRTGTDLEGIVFSFELTLNQSQFSSSGQEFLMGGWRFVDGEECRVFEVRDVGSGKQVSALGVRMNSCLGSSIDAASFYRGGKAVIVISDGVLSRWDVATDQCLMQYDLDKGTFAQSLALDEPGQKMAVGLSDGATLLLAIECGHVLKRLEGHAAGVTCVDFGSDGKRAVTGSADGALILWDLATGKQLHQYATSIDP